MIRRLKRFGRSVKNGAFFLCLEFEKGKKT
nr:MAG TPA: hypothetical protein [Caudoviricetes sp.]